MLSDWPHASVKRRGMLLFHSSKSHYSPKNLPVFHLKDTTLIKRWVGNGDSHNLNEYHPNKEDFVDMIHPQ